ncbi:MAG: hypothetical protein HY670_02460 [Chloroflexi bacterium]|nr:hypothetical protein [Chloroflexota bacterium]
MGLFKKSAVKRIHDGAWGHLVSKHRIDVDTLSNEFRCVERPGTLNGGLPVTFMRVFRHKDVEAKGIVVTGWETFDQYPEFVIFEGYLTPSNQAMLERKHS